MRYYLLAIICSTGLLLSAQGDSTRATPNHTVHIALLLNIDQSHTAWKVYGALNDKDNAQSDGYRLKQASKEAMDFYQGLQYALSVNPPSTDMEISLYDTHNNDSILMDILKNDTVRHADLIIGPPDISGAKMVASFCKKFKVPNIQPFVASKAITLDNPYLIRLCPTIDAHLSKIFESVVSAYNTANIIIYTTATERNRNAAAYLDTLFKNYNTDPKHSPISYHVVNAGDTTVPVAQRSYTYYTKPNGQNVIIMTCYDEVLVNSHLKGLKGMTVFGMPTWVDAEHIKPENLNNAEPYYTDHFYADTTREEILTFVHTYEGIHLQKPNRYCYLGYDVMNYLTNLTGMHGANIQQSLANVSYDGLGYSFKIRPVMRNTKGQAEPSINYYSNQSVHIFQIRDFKTWKVD
jgi:hypothetical protein